MTNTRIKKLQQHLKDWNVDALIVTNPIDLFYLTGVEMSVGKLFVAVQDVVLFVDGRYLEKCQKFISFPVVLDSKDAQIELFSTPGFSKVKTLGFDSNATSHAAFVILQQLGGQVDVKLVALSQPVHVLRIIKDPQEQQKLRVAASLCSKSFDYITTCFHPGITEKEVVQKLKVYWLQNGGDATSFEPIIAFGKNTSMPHYRSGDTELLANDIILVDIGVMVAGYHSDMTRMLFIGKPNPKLVEIAAVVKNAQEAAISACRPGVMTRDLDAIARNVIIKAGYGEFFVHGLGHGVGLEIHELPYLKKETTYPNVELAAGMVITIEPGIYIPDLGGVRVEDALIVINEGSENLTNRPHEPIYLKS